MGRLATSRGQIWFEYDRGFLETGIQLSPVRLPLKDGVFSGKDSPFDGLFGVFNDSLPDGWGRLLLDRAMTSRGIDYRKLSPLDRLGYVGARGMGALTYKPDYSMDLKDKEAIDLDSLSAEIDKVLLGEMGEILEELYNLGGSSAGAKPKVLIGYNRKNSSIIHGHNVLPEGYEHWLVKFTSSSDQKDSGKIEYAYSIMAKEAGIEMPETMLFRGRRNNCWFGIKRFDRVKNHRIHLHSASGLLHADHRIPSLDYDTLMRGALILRSSIREATKLFRLAVFNVFAHNRDDHGKNFSFLMDAEGKWRFSPAYDLTFSVGPGGEHSTMIYGEGKNPTSIHLAKLADRFGIKNAKTIIEEVKETVHKWPLYAMQAEVSKTSLRTIKKETERMILL